MHKVPCTFWRLNSVGLFSFFQKKSKLKKKAKHQGVVDHNKYGAYGIIRESDIFVKQQEFYCWLQEVKNVNSETLPKFETRKMFEDYMEDYNTATLPHKKYVCIYCVWENFEN
jgi:effector-binding domain-containing protein